MNDDEREIIEKKKYDTRAKHYRQNKSDLLVASQAWRKFDSPMPPSDPYNYSIRALGDLNGKRLMEVGCGTGWLSVIFAKRGAIVYGFDIAPENITIAKERIIQNDVNESIFLDTMSAHVLRYKDNYFDLVYGLSILHHVNVPLAVKEVHRVLKPGGKAVFSEPLAASRTLRFIRQFVPVPSADDSEEPAPPISFDHLKIFYDLFQDVLVTEFQLLTRLERLWSNPLFVNQLKTLDSFLLSRFSPLRKLARQVVVEASK